MLGVVKHAKPFPRLFLVALQLSGVWDRVKFEMNYLFFFKLRGSLFFSIDLVDQVLPKGPGDPVMIFYCFIFIFVFKIRFLHFYLLIFSSASIEITTNPKLPLQLYLIPFAVVVAVCFFFMIIFSVSNVLLLKLKCQSLHLILCTDTWSSMFSASILPDNEDLPLETTMANYCFDFLHIIRVRKVHV